MEKKKVVIVGSGVGGSGVAALLASDDRFRVHLVEKNPFLGGRFATYEKEGYKIDVGCHLLANCDRGSMGRILEKIGRADAVKWDYARNPRPIFHFCGEWMKFPKEIWKLKLPADDLQRMMRMFQEVQGWDEEKIAEHENVDLASFLRRYSSDEKLLSIFQFLMGMLFVVPVDEVPVSEWVRCQRQMDESRATGNPLGGTGEIPKAYARYVEDRGGRVSLDRPVKRILIEDGRAVGIEHPDGTVEKADIVVSNAGIKATVLALAGSEHFPAEFVERVEGYRYSLSVFLVKLGLKKKITDRKMIMYISSWKTQQWADEVMKGKIPEKALALFIPIVSNIDKGAAPEGKQLILAGSGCPSLGDFPEIDWKGWEECCMRGLRDIWPDIDEHIEFMETTSPIEIDRIAGEGGNVVGVGQTIGQMGKDRPPRKLPGVENLYCACADTGEHGVGGELAADSALRLFEELTKG